jgi:hypothetical protein
MRETREATYGGGGVATGETRSGNAEVHMNIHPGKNRYGGFPNIYVPTIFCGAATRSEYFTSPSTSRYPIIDELL